MNRHNLPGGNLLTTLIGWMVLLPVLAVVTQILVIELLEWVQVLAPWLLLTVVIGGGITVAAAIIRRRHYGY